ncbi:uncharacterized protein LOC143563595 [Bidens hawaiensis]|uniref:uncharacterized protein LOC143563595 n=1 Tax=Bidens hawaiensis TaxID=980011 RepID=UPI0040493D4B
MEGQAAKETNTNPNSFQCLMLTATNYTIWAMRMKVIFNVHGVWGAIEPDNTDSKQNNIATAVLFQSIPKDQILQIGDLNTTKEMWEAIKSRHLGADWVKEARLQTLIEEFDVMRMKDSDTIDNYATQITGIKSKASTLGEPFEEKRLVKKFLTSLPRRFIHIVASLEQILDLITVSFEDVVGRLKAYEERTRDEDQPDSRGKLMFHKSDSYTNRNSSRDQVNRGRGRGASSSRGCGRGRDAGQDRNREPTKTRSNQNRRDQNERGKRDLSHIKCYRCDTFGHFVSKCPEKFKQEANMAKTNEDEPKVDGAFFMMNSIQETVHLNEEKVLPNKLKADSSDKDVWYLDNGASNHMTGNRAYFAELNNRITGRVKFGDGSCVMIKGKGSILFDGKTGEKNLLTDIYYILDLQNNIISLGQATESGCDVRMRADYLTMHDKNGVLLMKVTRNKSRL